MVMPMPNAEQTPFHYLEIVRELSYAMQHTLNASDWHEGVVDPTLSRAFREQEEYGNLKIALSRLKGAFAALATRLQALHDEIVLREAPQLTPAAEAERQRYAREHADGLPPELRP